MKRILILLSIAVLCFACDRDDDDNTDLTFESTGEIIGQDFTLCACCGGYLVKFEGEDNTFNFSSLPESSDIDLEEEIFPLKIKVNWTGSISEACPKIVRIDNLIKD